MLNLMICKVFSSPGSRGSATSRRAALLFAFWLPLVAAGAPAASVDWPLHGLDSREQRFSGLDQINLQSVPRLGLHWSLELPRAARALQATPLAVDGTLYFTVALNVAWAVDAATGQVRWTFDPKSGTERPRDLRLMNGVSRGLAYDRGRVFVAASDGRLIALDAASGKPIWQVQTVEPGDRKQNTGAPRVFNGRIILGNSGADFGTRGYVTAYDQESGRQLWRFFTVPGNPADGPDHAASDSAMALAQQTWNGEWWRWGGGGTVWGGITFDSELNRIYIGVGNSANYNPRLRSPGGGDNLFLASIVALDADSGGYLWHYQVNPNEAWDFKATADMVLADLEIGGRTRKVLMQAPTNGFFYVIDRMTGRVISAEKIGKATWAERIDLETGRPVEVPDIRYENGPVTLWPSPFGVHNWHAMSFSPQTGLVYVPTMKLPAIYYTNPAVIAEAEQQVIGGRRYSLPIGARYTTVEIEPDDGTGTLLAWDPVAQQARWRVQQSTMVNGGTLATAGGLVFQGRGDGWFVAHDAADGRELWKFNAGNGIVAPPITYSVDGVQYLSILAGYGIAPDDPGWRYGVHPPRLLTFRLGGTAELPPTPGPHFGPPPLPGPPLPFDAAAAARGAELYAGGCGMCHGGGERPAGGNGPDLRGSAIARDAEAFRHLLRSGALAARGMPLYDELSDAEIDDLRSYILSFHPAHGAGEKTR